jgi:protein-serine/threonine kinase
MGLPRIQSGAVIDGFLIGDRVHRGGMASLWQVTREDLPLPLLMKVPMLAEGGDPAAIVGFEMEEMILQRLSGPHVPRFVAAGDFAVQPYLVMERIAGTSLLPLLTRLPLPYEEVASIGARIAAALDDLHRQHLVHLDLKPSNVMTRSTGEMVLIDFGLSHHDQLPDLMGEEFRLPYGTAPYMAPEQVMGQRKDPRSDQFALGVLMYFFATGVRPFGDPQRLSGLKRRLWRDPVPPRKLRPDFPKWLQEIILRCLEVNPAWRFPTAAKLAQDLLEPGKVKLTGRSERLRQDSFTTVLKRRFNPDHSLAPSSEPVAGQAPAGPTLAVAVDLAEAAASRAEALRQTVSRLLCAQPDARVACLTVLKQGVITLDTTLDEKGRHKHLQRLVELKQWAEPLGFQEGRASFHVLESPSPASAILRYLHANRVDHVVLGARTGSRIRNLLGSVASEVAAHAPCTVTIVRLGRPTVPEGLEPSDDQRESTWTVG